MSIDEKTAAHVAKLARIQVDAARLPELAQEFNTILGFIEQLSEVDVEGSSRWFLSSRCASSGARMR